MQLKVSTNQLQMNWTDNKWFGICTAPSPSNNFNNIHS